MCSICSVAFVVLALGGGYVLSLTASTVEEKVVSKAENAEKVLIDYNGRDRREVHRSGLKIGMFTPLVCEHLRRHMIRKGRDIERTERGTRRARLGFFTEIYCKGLRGWLDHGKAFHRHKPRDCQDVQRFEQKFYGRKIVRSNVYTIYPIEGNRIKVYCDMKTAGGGWTVFQHRYDGSVDFYRSWTDYKTGFGNLYREFWLGNDNIHRITAQGKYKLRIQMEDIKGNKRYAEYSSFSVADEKNKYRLNIGSYSGTTGDSLSYHNNMMFSTKDKDNDKWSGSCSNHSIGAWWYNKCKFSNLNGFYKGKTNDSKYDVWYHWPGGKTMLKSTTMMMRTI